MMPERKINERASVYGRFVPGLPEKYARFYWEVHDTYGAEVASFLVLAYRSGGWMLLMRVYESIMRAEGPEELWETLEQFVWYFRDEDRAKLVAYLDTVRHSMLLDVAVTTARRMADAGAICEEAVSEAARMAHIVYIHGFRPSKRLLDCIIEVAAHRRCGHAMKRVCQRLLELSEAPGGEVERA